MKKNLVGINYFFYKIKIKIFQKAEIWESGKSFKFSLLFFKISMIYSLDVYRGYFCKDMESYYHGRLYTENQPVGFHRSDGILFVSDDLYCGCVV